MNNKNKIGALAVKCEEQKERILELESELRRAKYNQEINDVTKNRLSMAIKYLEGQVEILRCCLQSVTNNMVRTGNISPEGSGEMNGDLISRNALLKKKWDADTRCGYVQVVDVGDIFKVPTVAAVPVVRCGECKFYNDELKCPVHDEFGEVHFQSWIFVLVDKERNPKYEQNL